MARIRSPNYPQMSLPEAISRVEKVWQAEATHLAPKEVMVKHLGYSSVNGASLGTLSALLKYGLLERESDDYRVSGRAMAIMHPHTPEEKAKALREAATAPVLFGEIMENFNGVLPSDDNLRAHLIRRGFAPSAISGVIVALRETMQLVAISPKHYTTPAPVTAKQEPKVHTDHVVPKPLIQQEIVRKLLIQMDGEALQVSAGLVDQSDVDRLITILQANRMLLPESRAKPDPVGLRDDTATDPGADANI